MTASPLFAISPIDGRYAVPCRIGQQTLYVPLRRLQVRAHVDRLRQPVVDFLGGRAVPVALLAASSIKARVQSEFVEGGDLRAVERCEIVIRRDVEV